MKLMLPACQLCYRKGEKTFAGDEPVTFTYNGEESTLWLCDDHHDSIVEFLTDLQAVARGEDDETEDEELDEESEDDAEEIEDQSEPEPETPKVERPKVDADDLMDPAKIREWWKANSPVGNRPYKSRGPVPQPVVYAYKAAHGL